MVVAYDGSPHAARTLQILQVLGLEGSQEVHVVCVDSDQAHADRCVERAVAFNTSGQQLGTWVRMPLTIHNLLGEKAVFLLSRRPAGK